MSDNLDNLHKLSKTFDYVEDGVIKQFTCTELSRKDIRKKGEAVIERLKDTIRKEYMAQAKLLDGQDKKDVLNAGVKACLSIEDSLIKQAFDGIINIGITVSMASGITYDKVVDIFEDNTEVVYEAFYFASGIDLKELEDKKEDKATEEKQAENFTV